MTPIHEQIRNARLQSGLSREAWGKAIGVTRANTYRIEQPDYNFKINVLKNICKISENIFCISKNT